MNAKSNSEISEFIQDTFKEFKDYIDLQIRYNKLIAAKKTGEISSFLALFVIVAILGAFFLLMASLGFVWWYSRNNPADRYEGFLIVMAFYFLFGLVIYLFREKLIYKPLKRVSTRVFFDEDKPVFKQKIKKAINESGKEEIILKETILDLSDPATFRLAKEMELAKIKHKEKLLQDKFEKAKETFDLANITKAVFDSFKEKIISTATLAKLTYTSIKMLTKRRKKSKKEEKKMINKKTGK